MRDDPREEKVANSPETPFVERRRGGDDRRAGLLDRRRGLPERRRGPVDRRVGLVDRRKALTSTRMPGAGTAAAAAANTAPAAPQARLAQASGKSVARRRPNGPLIVDAQGVDKTHRVFQVEANKFMSIAERMEVPLIIHHKKRRGLNCYFMLLSGVVIETRTPERLSLLHVSEQEMGHAVGTHKPEASAPQPSAPSTRREPVRPTQPETGKRGPERRRALMEYYTEEGYYVTEWWNTPDDPALSVARIRIEPGASTGSYELHGITERFLFLTGHGTVEINGKRYDVSPGDGVLVKPGAKRSITNRGETDMGLLAICRPRFNRVDPNLDKYKYVRRR